MMQTICLKFDRMRTIFLKFDTQEHWQSFAELLYDTRLDNDGSAKLVAKNDATIDVIGIITKGGKWDADGNEMIAPVVLDGWHVNFIGELPEELICFMVWPKNPVRLFYI